MTKIHKTGLCAPVAVLLLVLSASLPEAQQTSTVFVNQLRLDLRMLGHPPLDVIPPGESAITSLVIGRDGCLYGGTSGRRAHLFSLDPEWGHVFPLGHLEGEESIFHSLAAGPDGAIYIGTSLYNRGRIDERGRDVLAKYEGYAGGHLYRFDPEAEREGRERMQTPDPQRILPFTTDRGIPFEGQGITCLIMGTEALYGVTFPDGRLFSADPATGVTKDLGEICGPPLNEEPFRSIPRALVRDDKGRIWGAGDYGALFHFDPRDGWVVHHPDRRLPGELGREFKTVLDAMLPGPDGWIYGGTSDGFLFRFDPETLEIVSLGKPMWQTRIRGLAFSPGGDLYGVGGGHGGAVRLFVYRNGGGGFRNLGMLDVNRSPYYAWHAFEADAMVSGPDGTIFIGESGRISHLYLLYPW
jgi:sugar lactone lactonase YvrE